jgi:hypothetical protein
MKLAVPSGTVYEVAVRRCKNRAENVFRTTFPGFVDDSEHSTDAIHEPKTSGPRFVRFVSIRLAEALSPRRFADDNS